MNTPKKTALEVIQNQELSDKVILITGGYAGLGAASAKALLSAKATVIIAGRNVEAQQKFASELLNDKSLKIDPDQIDVEKSVNLADLASVSQFGKHIDQKYRQIDVLMLNAGVMKTPAEKTKDGFEVQMGINAIGHFLLAKILASKTKRQVWMSSAGHALVDKFPGEHSLEKAPRIDLEAIKRVDKKNYHSWRRYQQSKLANILLSKQFIREFPRLHSYSVHPGVNQTNLGRNISFWSQLKLIPKILSGQVKVKKPEEGAATQVYCSIAPFSELKSGQYYADCHVEPSSKSSNIAKDAQMLYSYCDQATREFQ